MRFLFGLSIGRGTAVPVARQLRGTPLPKLRIKGIPFLPKLIWAWAGWCWVPAALLAGALTYGAPAILWTYQFDRAHGSQAHTGCTWLSIQGKVRGVPRLDAENTRRCATLTLVPIDWQRWPNYLPRF